MDTIKYLKYKNKYLKLKNIYGGELNKEQKKQYLTELTKLFIDKDMPEQHYSNILKTLLSMMYEDINRMLLTTYKAEILQSNSIEVYNDIEIKFKKIYEEIKRIYSSKEYILDIPEYNIRGFQIVILLTLIVKLTDKHADTSMTNYFQRDIKINEVYEQLIKIWYNYEELNININEKSIFVNLKFIKKSESKYTPFTFKNISNSRILIYLDYVSIKDFIFSYINEIYYLGISTKMEWADGRLLTPFEFTHHDITHANNRGMMDGYDVENEKTFFTYINSNPDISKDQLKQINIIFFLIIHESMIEYITYNKRIDKFTFDDLFPTFIQDLDNWTNENYYGLLLPKDLLRTKDKLKIVLYLEDCIKLFVKKWNECFNK